MITGATGVGADESARLRVLAAYGILDTPPERDFDDLAALAAEVCHAPREDSFCAQELDTTDVLEVPDTHADPRFAQNPHVVGEPFARFYAGARLVAPSGHVLGRLCVIDYTARTLTPAQRRALKSLARPRGRRTGTAAARAGPAGGAPSAARGRPAQGRVHRPSVTRVADAFGFDQRVRRTTGRRQRRTRGVRCVPGDHSAQQSAVGVPHRRHGAQLPSVHGPAAGDVRAGRPGRSRDRSRRAQPVPGGMPRPQGRRGGAGRHLDARRRDFSSVRHSTA